MGAYKPGQYRPSEEDFKAGFKEKLRFFKTFFFKKSDYHNKIVGSFDCQLQLHCQQIHCLHEISFHFWMNRRTDVSSDINRRIR